MVLDLQRQLVELRAQFDDLAHKHERLRGAFYQARAGLAADGETPITPGRPRRLRGGVAPPETREQFRARMTGQRAAPPADRNDVDEE